MSVKELDVSFYPIKSQTSFTNDSLDDLHIIF